MADDRSKTYLWCANCRRSFSHDDAPSGACPVCHAQLRPIGKWSAIMRGLMSQELALEEEILAMELEEAFFGETSLNMEEAVFGGDSLDMEEQFAEMELADDF